jgi:hypothetical protein
VKRFSGSTPLVGFVSDDMRGILLDRLLVGTRDRSGIPIAALTAR